MKRTIYIGLTKNEDQIIQVGVSRFLVLSQTNRMNFEVNTKIEKKTRIKLKYTFEF